MQIQSFILTLITFCTELEIHSSFGEWNWSMEYYEEQPWIAAIEVFMINRLHIDQHLLIYARAIKAWWPPG